MKMTHSFLYNDLLHLNNGLDDMYRIDFDADPDMDAVTMQGDDSLISRMLGNLIQNSISHKPDGCHIIVTVRKVTNGCEYSVTDDGAGLSKKQLKDFNDGIFSEANYKENGDTAHGFGLRLVQQIIKAHGGSIAYENGLTSGLSVKIFIPL